jgi:hypothetical protein
MLPPPDRGRRAYWEFLRSRLIRLPIILDPITEIDKVDRRNGRDQSLPIGLMVM